MTDKIGPGMPPGGYYDPDQRRADGQGGSPQGAGVAGADVLETLAELERFVAGQLGSISSRDPALQSDGSGAIGLPVLATLEETAGMSTADLLQLIRAESRKTTEALLATTMESIQILKAQIKQYSEDSMAQLETAAESQEKARKTMIAMEVVKWAALAVGAVVSVALIIGSGGLGAPLALAIFSACLLIGTTCLSEIKGKDGQSPMDAMMKDLTEAMKKFAEAYGDMPAWAKDVIAGGMLLATIALAAWQPATLSVMLPLLGIAVVGALPDKVMSDDMKAQIMASIVMLGAMLVLSSAAAGAAGSMAARGAAAVVSTEVEAAVEVGVQRTVDAVAQFTQKLARYGTMFQSSLEVAQSGANIALGLQQYRADVASANVQALKELLKMQDTLLQSDSDFVQMLSDIQAQLDSGCAEIVAAEHQTHENINREMFS